MASINKEPLAGAVVLFCVAALASYRNCMHVCCGQMVQKQPSKEFRFAENWTARKTEQYLCDAIHHLWFIKSSFCYYHNCWFFRPASYYARETLWINTRQMCWWLPCVVAFGIWICTARKRSLASRLLHYRQCKTHHLGWSNRCDT